MKTSHYTNWYGEFRDGSFRVCVPASRARAVNQSRSRLENWIWTRENKKEKNSNHACVENFSLLFFLLLLLVQSSVLSHITKKRADINTPHVSFIQQPDPPLSRELIRFLSFHVVPPSCQLRPTINMMLMRQNVDDFEAGENVANPSQLLFLVSELSRGQ